MKSPANLWGHCLVAALAGAMGLPSASFAQAPATPPGAPDARSLADKRCEYGITLALKGDVVRAESAFVAMLSAPTADARAFNNIGNVHFLRGEFDLALAFYDRAARADTIDAGVELNRATTFMMLGDELRSRITAAKGIRLAGGEAAAARLLGLKVEETKPMAALAAEGAWISKDEVRGLLAFAAKSVPPESTRAVSAESPKSDKSGAASKRTAGSKGQAARRKTATLRSAGPRGAEGTDAAAVLYWKR